MANEQSDGMAVVGAVRSPQYRVAYINHATGGITNWDIHFTFGTLVETEPGKPAVEEQVMLVMTYEFAKAMVSTFGNVLKAYENKAPLPQDKPK